MININWTKEVEDVVYQMEFVDIRYKNYLVKFSATSLDVLEGEDDTSSSCLVELSSYEIATCNTHPKDAYFFIKSASEGRICYAIDFCHDKSQDPEYAFISEDIHTIYSIDGYIKRLREKSIEHDLTGCVVNPQSCVVHDCYFAQNEKAVFNFVENVYKDTVNTIREWEAENCHE
jgi:hypothetical protein